MANLGVPVDLSRYLGERTKIRNRIEKVGIELEGGWNKINPENGRFVADSSVSQLNFRHVGEFVSDPIPIKNDYKPVDKWLEENYPDGLNHTCGLHVHMSFDSAINYMRLLRSEFPATVVKAFGDWATREKLRLDHSLWDRLQGKSIYCQHQYQGDDQLLNNRKDYEKNRKGHRYTVINYAYNRTGTLECRLLPMLDTVEQALSAVHEVLDVTNAFLVATATREKKLKVEVTDDSRPTRESHDIYVP